MDLPTFWFILIATLWSGYFILEGFDFGVGALLPVLGRTDATRTTILATIAPVWDGNEVWLIVAAGATFAAFPAWYATMFSGFYLLLLAILVALIVRAVGLEYRTKRPDPAWRRRWDACITIGSHIPAFGWGVVFANLIAAVPIAGGHYTGNVTDLFHPYALTGGAAFTALFHAHGAAFLALKTRGRIHRGAVAATARLSPAALITTGGFLLWTAARHHETVTTATAIVGVAALAAAVMARRRRRDGWAFAATTLAVAATMATIFCGLFPNVMPSSLGARHSLTIDNAAASAYSLKIMTIAAVVFTPLVLAYQGWTYWVFRHRLTAEPASR
jgi:cytochrome d ubiquinol oxidase subunit II